MQRPWAAASPAFRGGARDEGRSRAEDVPRLPARKVEGRARNLFYFFLIVGLFLIYRLYTVQVVDGPWLAEKARLQRESTVALDARRGTIYDRNGAFLARSLETQSVHVLAGALPKPADKQRVATELGAALGIAPERVYRRIEDEHTDVIVMYKVPDGVADRVSNLNDPSIELESEPTSSRFVPSGRLASTVVGFTDEDDVAHEGIEKGYDKLLRAQPGSAIDEGDLFGRILPFGEHHVVASAKPAKDLYLTLDSDLQFGAERVLRATVAQYHAASGTAIVMDPNTGEILALANVPDYDINDHGSNADHFRDRAVTDVYEPGSTFKLVTAAAALDSGKVTPTARFPRRDWVRFGGYVIHNADDGFTAGASGTETLEDIIVYSHNVGAAEVAGTMGERTMYEALRRFGFDEDTQSGLPGEVGGRFDKLDEWSETTLPTIAYGHGIAVTPLELARAYCAIANGGMLVRPRIVGAIASDGKRQETKPVFERRAISEKTAALLRRYLREVVTRGTGTAAQIPGFSTAGKTGTAQIPGRGGYEPDAHVASFAGFVPAEHPRYVILVKVERPRGSYYGGVVAAPAFARIAKLAMMRANVVPDLPPDSVNAGRASKQPR